MRAELPIVGSGLLQLLKIVGAHMQINYLTHDPQCHRWRGPVMILEGMMCLTAVSANVCDEAKLRVRALLRGLGQAM